MPRKVRIALAEKGAPFELVSKVLPSKAIRL
jgi:glutathione S-transferase